MAYKIVETDDHRRIYNLAEVIFQVVAIEIDSSDDLLSWIEISEWIDRFDYDIESFTLNKREVISRIKNEARLLLSSDH